MPSNNGESPSCTCHARCCSTGRKNQSAEGPITNRWVALQPHAATYGWPLSAARPLTLSIHDNDGATSHTPTLQTKRCELSVRPANCNPRWVHPPSHAIFNTASLPLALMPFFRDRRNSRNGAITRVRGQALPHNMLANPYRRFLQGQRHGRLAMSTQPPRQKATVFQQEDQPLTKSLSWPWPWTVASQLQTYGLGESCLPTPLLPNQQWAASWPWGRGRSQYWPTAASVSDGPHCPHAHDK